MSDSRTDNDLVAAANAGDASALEALYLRHRDWVIGLAWRFTADREIALDVCQETFTYLLGKFPGFRLTAAMTTFLYPVVRNIAIRQREKRDRHVLSEQAILAAPSRDMAHHNPRQELAEFVAGLPPDAAETLLMRFADGMQLDEIAHALDCPVGTIKSRLHRTLSALRKNPKTRKYFAR